jgi:hypothetical protein
MRFSLYISVLTALLSSSVEAWYRRKSVPKRKSPAMPKGSDSPREAALFRKPSGRNWSRSNNRNKQVHVNVESSSLFDRSSGQQTVTDHGDTYLTISLEIGAQQIKAIPDSGSFELYIVDGADCDLELCKPAYNPDESEQHFSPTTSLSKDIYFGSGTCGVELSFDSVKVHNELESTSSNSLTPLIPLWRIIDMDENLASVWGDGTGFQGIVGLGFKGNAHKETTDVLLEEQVLLEAKQKTGVNPTRPGLASRALFGDLFAICLPRGEDAKSVEVLMEDASPKPSQNDGRLWWGKSVPQLEFLEVPVVGTRHWTVRVDSSYFQYKDSSDALHHICGGPSKSPCAALVDSGTSLIALSEGKITELLETTVIGSLNPDCSNVEDMPDLVFTLGQGKELRLTPDTYVMKISTTTEIPMMHETNGRVVLEKGKVLNIRPPPSSLISLKGVKGDSITYCTHAFMETPMETALVGGTEHELIILGIPIFREYTIKFDRSKETMGFAQHPFGVTCHSEELASSFGQGMNHRSPLHIRTLSRLHDLVFPNEFDEI